MRTALLLAIAVLLAAGQAAIAHPSSQPHRHPFHVVALSALELQITRNRFGPYRDNLARRLQRNVSVTAISSYPALEQLIARHQADLIFLTSRLGQQLEAEHGYQLIAETRQPIYLYVTREQRDTPLAQIKRVGLVENTGAEELALDSLNKLLDEFELSHYPQHSAALLALFNGEVDALAAIPLAVSGLASSVARRVIARSQLGEGVAVAAISPQWQGREEAWLVAEQLLNNGPLLVDVFQKGFGLGPFTTLGASAGPAGEFPRDVIEYAPYSR